MEWICGNCPVREAFTSLNALSDHYTGHHHQAASFNCILDGCQQSFLNKSSLFRHLRNFHTGLSVAAPSSSSHVPVPPCNRLEDGNSEIAAGSGHSGFGLGVMHDESYNDNNEDLLNSTISTNREYHPSVDLNKVAAQVVMELRSKASLTGKAVERFEDGCTKLLENYRVEILNQVIFNLKLHGMSDADSVVMVEGIPNVTNVFDGLRSIQDQLEVFEKEFGLVKPVEKFLGRTRIDQRLDPQTNTYVQTQVNVSFQYVSIVATLKTVLSKKGFRSQIFKDYTSNDGILRSYMDGNHCKSHPYVKKFGNNVIHIIIFYDELEVSNALGSKTIIHKLGAFFFQILNGPASTGSKLSSIHLLILSYADDLKVPGAFEKVLTPFILEMKKLSSDEGVEMIIDGKPLVVRALLAAVTADTLAAHDLLGFLSPSANHFCRCCMIHRADFRQDGNLIATPRKKETHDVHVQQVLADSRLSSTCGVKGNCALNQVPYFHCAESSVFDAFHDLLEGVAPLVIKLVLRHFICVEKVMSLEDFNISVASFSYGIPDAKNKPSPNFTREMLVTRKKLKQTGSQMWCLIRALPLLIVDRENKILPGDRHLEIVFLLQDIMKIIFSFEVSLADLDRLEGLIFQHHELFKSLFVDTPIELEREVVRAVAVDPEGQVFVPEEEEGLYDTEETADEDEEPEAEAEGEGQDEGQARVRRRLKKLIIHMTNKLHHLTHYCEKTRQFGPAIRMWCAKFEGRLKIFRQHAAAVCNFKNIPKTMAEMFQLSNVIQEGDEEMELEFHKVTECSVGDLGILRPLFHNINLDDSKIVLSTNSATLCGEEYRPGLFVRTATSVAPRYSPHFAIINNVYVHEHTIYLLVKPWKVVCLSARYNCYRVVPDDTSVYSVVNVKNLANYRAIAPWSPCETTDIFLSVRTDSV